MQLLLVHSVILLLPVLVLMNDCYEATFVNSSHVYQVGDMKWLI